MPWASDRHTDFEKRMEKLNLIRLRKIMRDSHSFVPLARRCAGHGLPRGSRSLVLPPPHGWLSMPWVRLVRRCSLAALHKAARSRVAS